MNGVVYKAGAYIFVIIFGFLLKRLGYFKQSDYKILTTTVFNFTLPAAILSNLGSFEFDRALLLMIPFGLLSNLLCSLIGNLLAKGKSVEEKAEYAMNITGFSVGPFIMPLVNTFLGPAAMVSICMFDIGNALMCTGGNQAIGSLFINGKANFDTKAFLKKLFKCLAFSTYFIFIPMAILNLQLPSPVKYVVDAIAPANGILSMFMIGVAMDIQIKKEYLGKCIKLLVLRVAAAAVIAAALYAIAPLPTFAKQSLVMCLFGPVSSLAAYQAEELGGSAEVTGFVDTLSIPVSILIIIPLISLVTNSL